MKCTPGLKELRKFVVPEFVFGAGARFMAGRYCKNLGARRVLIVTDPGVIAAGWTREVVDCIEAEHITCVIYSGVTPNPKDEEVMEGARIYEREDCNAIVVVGGGSPMDCAKGIGIVSTNRQPIMDFAGVDLVSRPGPPLLCIPTTAGTSADVSQFAIISDSRNQVKATIVSKSVVPDAALIDPETTSTMDAFLTACSGMDALSHALEAYVSNANSPLTDLHALEAIRLLKGNLVAAIERPHDGAIRRAMMLGSLHSGLAFSNASLGALHALAHGVGGIVPNAHGQVAAVLMSQVIEYNYSAAVEQYRQIGEAMAAPSGGLAAITDALIRLRKAAGLDATLTDLGVKRSDIPAMAERALNDICLVTNPKPLTWQDIEAIYAKAL